MAGDRDGAAAVFLTEVVGVPWVEVEQQRASPVWPGRLAGVHAIPPGLRAFVRFRFDADRLRVLDIPTLLLVEGDSTSYHKGTTATVAAALPNAQVVVLPEQQHNANVTAPELLVAEIRRFLTARCHASEPTSSAAY